MNNMYIQRGDSPDPVGIAAGILKQIENDIESEIAGLRALHASLEKYGMAMVSESEAVTDVNSGLVLGAKEKNAAVPGSIMNFVENVRKNVGLLSDSSFAFRGFVTDFNTADKNGFYQYGGGDGIGAPQTNAFGILFNFIGGNYKAQIFLSFSSAFQYIYVRTSSNVSADYGSWKYITMQT